MLRIGYESRGFPTPGPVANGQANLDVSWDDILWAALTVGRPNRNAVFKHGDSSLYEAIFRLSLVRMALEQSKATARRLRRTAAARTLDPSEKGAINYFIGMTMCKLFADHLLHAPWMLHLDVFRPKLNPILTGRSRPDLIGQRTSGEWIALESKGRISAPDSTAKTKAKEQALRCVSVNGAPMQFHIGAITYLRKNVIQFYWRDPEPQRNEGGVPVDIQFNPQFWCYHYAPILGIIKTGERAPILASADVKVDVHPKVFSLLRQSQWQRTKDFCDRNNSLFREEGFRSDGVKVAAGPSWLKPFDEGFEQTRNRQ